MYFSSPRPYLLGPTLPISSYPHPALTPTPTFNPLIGLFLVIPGRSWSFLVVFWQKMTLYYPCFWSFLLGTTRNKVISFRISEKRQNSFHYPCIGRDCQRLIYSFFSIMVPLMQSGKSAHLMSPASCVLLVQWVTHPSKCLLTNILKST